MFIYEAVVSPQKATGRLIPTSILLFSLGLSLIMLDKTNSILALLPDTNLLCCTKPQCRLSGRENPTHNNSFCQEKEVQSFHSAWKLTLNLHIVPQIADFIIRFRAKEPLLSATKDRSVNTVTVCGGKWRLQTLRSSLLDKQRPFHLRKRDPVFAEEEFAPGDRWPGIRLQVKERRRDFTPWWTCAGPGRTRGCCSRTRCRTWRQSVDRERGHEWEIRRSVEFSHWVYVQEANTLYGS